MMTKHEQEIATLRLLDDMKHSELSIARAAWILYHDTRAFALSEAEDFLDDMWTDGLCINLGEFHGYRYRITSDGIDYLHSNLGVLLDHGKSH